MELLTVNLEKKLLKANKKLVTPQELLIIKEYEKISHVDNSDILNQIGLAANLEKGKSLKAKNLRLKSETSKFAQERVFHISQIETICRNYYLRFLPTEYFKGNVDEQLPLKIVNFETVYNITCYSKNMFIAAPKSSFKLEERPRIPLLFYKINDEYYYLVHKWGNDLSIFRRMLGILTDYRFALSLIIVPFLFCLYWVIFEKTIGEGNVIYPIGMVAIVGIICFFIVGMVVYGINNDERKIAKRQGRRPEYVSFGYQSHWNNKFND